MAAGGALQPLLVGCQNYKNIIAGTSTVSIKPASKHKGELALIYTDPEVCSLSDRLQLALIGKFTSERPPMEFLHKGFKTIGFKGDYQLGLVDEQHILIRFELTDDYHRYWLHGIWNFKSYKMRVLKWTPTFHVEEEPAVAPIWVSLECLPHFLFSKEPIFSIGNLIGKPLKIDSATENLTRPSVARICVEIDLLKPLPRRLWIEHGERGYWQIIKYESIPAYCFSCKRFGHSNGDCNPAPLTQAEPKEVWRPRLQTNNKEQAQQTVPLGEAINQQVQQSLNTNLNLVVADVSNNVLVEQDSRMEQKVNNIDSAVVSDNVVVVQDSMMEHNVSDIDNVTGPKEFSHLVETTPKISCLELVCTSVKTRTELKDGPQNAKDNFVIPTVEATKEATRDMVKNVEQCTPVVEEPTSVVHQVMDSNTKALPASSENAPAVHSIGSEVVAITTAVQDCINQQGLLTPQKQHQFVAATTASTPGVFSSAKDTTPRQDQLPSGSKKVTEKTMGMGHFVADKTELAISSKGEYQSTTSCHGDDFEAPLKPTETIQNSPHGVWVTLSQPVAPSDEFTRDDSVAPTNEQVVEKSTNNAFHTSTGIIESFGSHLFPPQADPIAKLWPVKSSECIISLESIFAKQIVHEPKAVEEEDETMMEVPITVEQNQDDGFQLVKPKKRGRPRKNKDRD